jgi:hypothetical protein
MNPRIRVAGEQNLSYFFLSYYMPVYYKRACGMNCTLIEQGLFGNSESPNNRFCLMREVSLPGAKKEHW